MDFESVILGIAILVVCLLPFAFLNVSKKRKQKAFFQLFLNHAHESQSLITVFDIFDKYLLAFNKTNRRFYFFNTAQEKIIFHNIDLAQISSVKLDKQYPYDAANKRIDQLCLVFTFKDLSSKTLSIELYNRSKTFQLSGELQLAERWLGLINEGIQK
jgi:hypothetical protein